MEMRSINKILKEKGLTAEGDVQMWHTRNVLHRIVRYMPYRSGATIKLTASQSPVNRTQIITDTPYAKYLYYGKVMIGTAPKTATDHDLEYTTTKNPQAGPYWDRRLMAAEGAVIQEELQRYIERKAGTK